MEEREEERKKKVADKRAAEARRRLREVQVDDYQPNQWENKDEIEEVTTAVERIGSIKKTPQSHNPVVSSPLGSMYENLIIHM